jgi:L-lysine 6-transaminase
MDKDTKDKYLDFFGQYATLALGYNHPIFKSEQYLDEVRRVAHQKITNCEILSDESAEFDQKFRSFTSKGIFTHYHYSCTGALAIEAAVKTAMDYKGPNHHRVVSFKGSFHGINGYGGIFTDRFSPVDQRLEGYPGPYWEPITNPIIEYEKGKKVDDKTKLGKVLTEIEKIIKTENNVCAILVEPIQCTFGDRYFPEAFFTGVRDIATKYDVPVIFDEIQVGFGGTGKLWYYEHLPIEPDILVFGKKTQLSGIAVRKKFARIFEKPIRLEVTWDADIMDMVRCKYIIKAYEESNILNNVSLMAERLNDGLSKIKGIKNIRYCGLIFAFDFEEKSQRDVFMKELIENKMLCNSTRDKTVRLRPNLCVSPDEIDHALSIMSLASGKL